MLTDDIRSRLIPLLGPIARKVNAQILLQPIDFQQMLAPCGLQQNPDALDELRKWDVILRRLRSNPTAVSRQQTRDALLARGVPMAPAWLAVDMTRASRPHTLPKVASAPACQLRPSQTQQSAIICNSSVKRDPTKSTILRQTARVLNSEPHWLVCLFIIPIVFALLPFALAWRAATSKFGQTFIKYLFVSIALVIVAMLFIVLLPLIIIGIFICQIESR